MTSNSQKIYWGEGTLLTPQHFQQWDRYHDAVLRQRVRMVQPLDWGLRALEIDADALLGGELRVSRCEGVLRDGFYFDAPGRDPLPRPRSIADALQPTAGSLIVHLGVPVARSGNPICSSEDGDVLTPFRRGSATFADETRAGSERELATALANLRLLFDGESLDDYETIPIARVGTASTGGYRLENEFVPPCQYLSTSPFLMGCVRRVLEIISTKSEQLAGQQRRTGGMAEAFGFWLLHTVNSHVPRLQHYHAQGAVHPEVVFLDLASLAGELCTFFPGKQHPRDLPSYDHANLGPSFGSLDEKLRFLLDAVVPVKCVPIPLEQESEALFTAQIRDLELVQQAQLYLSVVADVPEERLFVEIPAKAKISSKDRVPQLITMALRGLSLRHVPTPPEEIPRQPGRVYFKLEKTGDHWDAITSSHSFAMQIPPEFPGLRIELLAVKE